MSSEGQLQDFSVDQIAAACVLLLGAVGALVSIVLKSRCECDLNLCYVWRCHRKPPPDPPLDEKAMLPTNTEPEPEPEPEPERQ